VASVEDELYNLILSCSADESHYELFNHLMQTGLSFVL